MVGAVDLLATSPPAIVAPRDDWTSHARPFGIPRSARHRPAPGGGAPAVRAEGVLDSLEVSIAVGS